MIKTTKKGSLIVISAPSGAGKGTIIKELLKERDNTWLSVSCTSRSIRPGDIPNETYFFLTKEEFEEKIKNDDMFEYAIVHGKDYYGTPKSEIFEKLNEGIDVILELDIQGALTVKEIYPQAIFIFILPPSLEEMKSRLAKRGSDSEESIYRRFVSMYKEMNEIPKYNYVIINDILENAVKKVHSVIDAEKCRVDRIEEIYVGNTEEKLHELILEGQKKFDNSK